MVLRPDDESPTVDPPQLREVAPTPTLSEPLAAHRIEGATELYASAISRLRAREYDAANQALLRMIARFPDDTLVGNAHYWRGECAYAKGDFAGARTVWRGGLALFPQGKKAADSWLKIAFASERLRDAVAEREAADILLKQFPDSAAAKMWRSRAPRVNVKGVSR